MIDDKIPRRINPKGIGLIYIYIERERERESAGQQRTSLVQAFARSI